MRERVRRIVRRLLGSLVLVAALSMVAGSVAVPAQAAPVMYHVGASTGVLVPGGGATGVAAGGSYTAARTTLFSRTPGTEPVGFGRTTDYEGYSTLFVAITPADYAEVTRIGAAAVFALTISGAWDDVRVSLYDVESDSGDTLLLGQGASGGGQGVDRVRIDLDNPAAILPPGHRLQVVVEVDKPNGGEVRVVVNGAEEDQTAALEIDEETDDVAPTTLVSTSPVRPGGDDDWFIGSPPLVTLSSVDPEGSATIVYYDIDVPEPGTVYTGTITMPAGESVLYFRSVDVFGNSETVRSQPFKVDTGVAAPTVSSPSGIEDAPARVRGPVPLRASVGDEVSGVQTVRFFAFARQGEGFAAVGLGVGGERAVPTGDGGYAAEWDTWSVPDGEYRVEAWVRDVAGNQAASQPQYVVVDNTGPAVLLTEPQAGGRVAGPRVEVTGTVDDADLSFWTLEVRAGSDDPWTTLASGTTPAMQAPLASLDTTAYDDGRLELRLSAADNTGNVSTPALTVVEVDNTPPTMVSALSGGPDQLQVGFSEALESESVSAEAFSIPGLDVTGAVLAADGRTVILTTAQQADGREYVVSVASTAPTIADMAGNLAGPPDSAAFVGSSVDTVPPAAPAGPQAVSGAGENLITWQASLEPDVVGYRVYRDASSSGSFSSMITPLPVEGTSYADATYGVQGIYSYVVTAVDGAGNESPRSPVTTAHHVRISSVVGPAGARLESSTGEFRMVIPPDAVSGEIQIEVTEGSRPSDLEAFSFVGPSYDILPAGQTFAADVSISVTYDAGLLGRAGPSAEETSTTAGTSTTEGPSTTEETSTAETGTPTTGAATAPAASESAIRLVYEDEGTWTRVEGGSTVDAVGDRVTGTTRHLTAFAPAVTDVVPPTVTGITPADGTQAVPVTSEVTLTFSEPMDPETLTAESLRILEGETVVALDPVAFSADLTTAYLYPRDLLDVNTEYRVVVEGSVAADVAGNPLGADASSTFTTSGQAVSPHAGYAGSPALCATCHGEGSPTADVSDREVRVCYTCHDGTGSAYGVKTTDPHAPFASDFGESSLGTTVKTSYHPVPSAVGAGTGATMTCSSCHNSHSLGKVGNRYLAIKPLEPGSGAAYAPVTGNQVCWTCHDTTAAASAGYMSTDSWNASTGYDHKTGYPSADVGHNRLSGDVSMVDPRVPSRERIACKGCHTEHGTSNDALIAEYVNGRAVTFDASSDLALDTTYNAFCGTCHVVAGSGGPLWPGGATGGIPSAATVSAVATSTAPAYARSGHGAAVKTRTISYTPPVPARNQTLTVGLCKQCHNPHGTAYRNYTLAPEEELCYQCHDQDGPAALTVPGRTSVSAQFTAGGGPASGVVGYRRPAGGASAVPLTRHPVADGEQGRRVGVAWWPGGDQSLGTIGSVECVNCHNPHLNGGEPPPSLYWKVLDPNVQPGRDGYPASLRPYRTGNSLGGVSYNSTGGNPGTDLNPDNPLGMRSSQPYNPPDGSFDATPDSVYFCLACHDRSVPAGTDPPVSMGSSPLDIRSDYLDPITANALAHGRGTGNQLVGDDIYLRYPYRSAAGGSRQNWSENAPARPYAALQCTTCHDPHGSRNVYLLREYIEAGGVVMNDTSAALGGTGSRGSGGAFSLPSWPMVADGGAYKLSNEFLVEFCGACHSQYGDFRNHEGGLAANGGPTGAGCDTAHNWSGWDAGNRGGLHDNNESDPTSRHKW